MPPCIYIYIYAISNGVLRLHTLDKNSLRVIPGKTHFIIFVFYHIIFY